MQGTASIHWNAYPALLASGVVAAGICASQALEAPVWMWMLASVISISYAAAATVRRSGLVQSNVVCASVGLALFAAAGLRHADTVTPPGRDLSRIPVGEEVRLFGRPVSAAATRSGVRFVLEVDSVRLDGRNVKGDGRVQVYVRGYRLEAARPCRRVAVEGRLGELPAVRNPGDFDYGEFLRGHRIFSRLFADELRPAAEVHGAVCLAHRLKATLTGYFERSMPDAEARSIVLALVVGDRSAIAGDTEEQFRRTGLLHLLAVSGLHVLIVGMILYQLLRPSLLRLGFSWFAAEYTRMVVTATVLLLYALVTGLPASVVRAVIMAMLFMMGTTFQRSSHSLNTLGVAVFILLLWRPSQLFEPGFQLSVSAVAAIVTLQPRFSAMLTWGEGEGTAIAAFLRSSASVSLAASAGTLPILLMHFGGVSFAGLILNTLAVPLTSITLAASVATAAGAAIHDGLGSALGFASQSFAQLLLFVVEEGEPYFRWAYLEARLNEVPVLAALVVGIVMVAQWPRPRIRWRLGIVALGLLAADQFWDAAEGEWRSHLELVFLDVGQGDAALIMFPNGRTMLIDAGPRTAFADAGRYTIVPYLQRKQIRVLDAVVVTHPDSDHLGGVPSILRAVQVNRLLHSGRPHDSELYDEVLHLVDSLNIPYYALRTGDTLSIDASVRVRVLHPAAPHLQDNPNASSIVLHLRFGRTSALLMGDAEREAEAEIIRRFGDSVESDVLKVGHHGSRTSSTPLMLSRVLSEDAIAVVSAGGSNRFGHPDSSVVRRLRSYGAQIRRTDRDGAVHVVSDGHRAHVRAWR